MYTLFSNKISISRLFEHLYVALVHRGKKQKTDKTIFWPPLYLTNPNHIPSKLHSVWSRAAGWFWGLVLSVEFSWISTSFCRYLFAKFWEMGTILSLFSATRSNFAKIIALFLRYWHIWSSFFWYLLGKFDCLPLYF